MSDFTLFIVILFAFVAFRFTHLILGRLVRPGEVQYCQPARWRRFLECALEVVTIFTIYFSLMHGAPLIAFVQLDFLRIPGAAVLYLGMVIHIVAKVQMGPNWTHSREGPVVRKGTITTHGLYGYSRNPMYLGFLFIMFGLVLALHNWVILALFVVVLLYVEYIISYEELYLRYEKGMEYERYCARVPRFLGLRSLTNLFLEGR